MGMFDWVKYEAPCRACGRILSRFQSKDGPCRLLKLEPSDVEEFYDLCPCGAWNEYRVRAVKQVTVLSCEVKLVPPGDAQHDTVPE